jgi:hypothetical protein
MPTIKMLRTLGTKAHKQHRVPFNKVDGADRPFQEGETYDVEEEVANTLIERKLAERTERMHAVPQVANLRGVPDQHVSQTDEADALATINKLRNKEALQQIVEHDSRPAVKEAARKRLGAL